MKTVEQIIPQPLRLFTHLMYFWIGGVLTKKLKEKKIVYNKDFTFIVGANLIGVAVIEYLICNKVLMINSPENLFNSPVIMTLACAFFIVFYSINYSDKASNVIEKLIPYSLGMYIIHPYIIRIMNHYNLFLNEYWVINFVILSVCSLLISFVISKIKYLNRIIKL